MKKIWEFIRTEIFTTVVVLPVVMGTFFILVMCFWGYFSETPLKVNQAMSLVLQTRLLETNVMDLERQEGEILQQTEISEDLIAFYKKFRARADEVTDRLAELRGVDTDKYSPDQKAKFKSYHDTLVACREKLYKVTEFRGWKEGKLPTLPEIPLKPDWLEKKVKPLPGTRKGAGGEWTPNTNAVFFLFSKSPLSPPFCSPKTASPITASKSPGTQSKKRCKGISIQFFQHSLRVKREQTKKSKDSGSILWNFIVLSY